MAELVPPPICPSGISCSDVGDNESPKCIDFADLKSFTSRGCNVWSESVFVCSCTTKEYAEYLVQLLSELKRSDLEQREAIIKASFRRVLSTQRAARRWKAFKKISGLLSVGSWAVFALFVTLFGMLLHFRFQLAAAWPLGVMACAFVPYTAYVFCRAHRIFFPTDAHERWKQVVLMFLTPTVSIRAVELIAHKVFGGSHCLSVARVILEENESRKFTADVLRDLLSTAQTEKFDYIPSASAWAKKAWMQAVWEWAEKEFGDPTQLLKAPKKENINALSYCPRCLAQYVKPRVHCADCPCVELREF